MLDDHYEDNEYISRKFTMGTDSGSRDIRVTLESGGKKGDLQFRHTLRQVVVVHSKGFNNLKFDQLRKVQAQVVR